MAGPGTLILSIDCEGLWGFADNPYPHIGVVTDESLAWAYRKLLELLDAEEFPATFAFVSLFVSERTELAAELNRLRDLPTHRDWLAGPLMALAAGDLSGWSRPQALAEVAARDVHEIASHSHTHLPLLETQDPSSAARVEHEGVVAWSRGAGIDLRTYVFPRNQVVASWPDGTELIGYRDRNTADSGVHRVLDELNIRTRAQANPAPAPGGRPIPIPGGHICNLRAGVRRRIPMSVTRARWRNICRSAAETGGVAHLWLHPHNLIVGDRQLELLGQMLGDARRWRRTGELVALTQREYSVSRLEASYDRREA